MKASKKIIGASCALVAAVALSAGSTFAWFSSNGTVTANNMQVKVTAPQALLISESASMVNSDSAVSFNDTENTTLSPATHYTGTEVATSSGLVYVSNAGDVNQQTGLANTDKTLTYSAATNDTTTYYFKDFVVYIASAGDAYTENLVVTLMYPEETIDSMLYAASIDFLVGTPETYKGTLNLAKKNIDTTQTAELTKVTLNAGVPVKTSPLKITMRVYFDGALEASPGQAYVNSSEISTENVTLGCIFSLEAAE